MSRKASVILSNSGVSDCKMALLLVLVVVVVVVVVVVLSCGGLERRSGCDTKVEYKRHDGAGARMMNATHDEESSANKDKRARL